MKSTRFKKSFRIIFVIMLVSIAALGIYDYMIPESISVFSDTDSAEITGNLTPPFVSASLGSLPEGTGVSYGENRQPFYSSLLADTKVFGIIPLKKVNVNVFKEITLYPGGMPFGVKLYTEGVIIAGIADVDTKGGKLSPAKECGLKVGDVIKMIDGKAVNTVEEVSAAVENSGNKSISLTVLRNGNEQVFVLTPVFSEKDNVYRAGLWLRDSTAGIGTVTFIVPESGAFGGLGHGICDVDTGMLMPIRRGTVVSVSIKGITKGTVGDPGELKGAFTAGKIGSLIGNTVCGVYGLLSDVPEAPVSSPMKIGLKDEITVGDAEIYCTVGEKTEKYKAEIVKICNKNGEQKNFIIKIVDKRLLDATGGIVQGMSGSPIIQNGKLVGAITHVLVNDPTKGYGIFIENMLKNMPEIVE